MLQPLKARGFTMYYDLSGPEDAPVVCITHSLLSDSGMWAEQMPALLEAGYRVLRLDQRGHGGSPPVKGDEDGYTMEDLSDDWAAALEALGLPRVHYIGLSIGGQSGQPFAIYHGDKLISAMWIGCAPSSGTVGDDVKNDSGTVDIVKKANSMEPMADRIMEQFCNDATKKSRPARYKQLRETVAETTLPGAIGGMAAIMNYDFTGELPSVKVPVLAVRGAEDPDGAEPGMRHLAELVPGGRLEQIPNANHFCNVDQPDAFNKIMMGWLDQHRKLT
ncbi:MAG TPA: alpha/beta hydrolase [Gemmataceae bacterium]|nr:alpha/beta hydrolase [Gemmataceae bacterium]